MALNYSKAPFKYKESKFWYKLNHLATLDQARAQTDFIKSNPEAGSYKTKAKRAN
jgi:hypothetical protein